MACLQALAYRVRKLSFEGRLNGYFPVLDGLSQDVRYGIRALGKGPGFAAVAGIALALGVGVNTTVFSAYNAIALKPFPVSDPDHVVSFKRWYRGRGWSASQFMFSYRNTCIAATIAINFPTWWPQVRN